MADKTELVAIVRRMESGGESEDTIKRFVQQWQQRNAVDDVAPTKEPSGATGIIPEPPGSTGREFDEYGLVGALFPRTVGATEQGAGLAERALAGMGDVATAPQRAVSAAATLYGWNTTESGRQNEAEKWQDVGRAWAQYRPAKETQGISRIGQEAAYDPTLIPGVVSGAAEAKLMAKIPGVFKAAVPAVSGALQAAGSSAIRQAAETGEIDIGETGKASAWGAAVPLAVAGITAAGKKVAESTGRRLIQALIRPGRVGMKEGFDVDYIMKDKELVSAAGHGIESLQSALKKKFNGLSREVKQIQQEAGEAVNIDVPSVYMKTARKLKASNEFTGKKRQLLDALADLEDNLNNEIESFDEYTDLATAMKLRTNYGTQVKFEPGISGGGRQAAFAANAEEKVYDAFYKELSAEIKHKAPDAIKEIDAQFTKLIPALKAVNRRVLVETSNLPVGLMEAAGGSAVGAATAMSGEHDWDDRLKRGLLGAAGGVVATKVLKSPRTGQLLYQASQKIPIPSGGATARFTNPMRSIEAEDDRRRMADSLGQAFGGGRR